MPDKDSKTEPPTTRRRQEARRGGQIGRSSDLTAAVVLLGALIFLQVTGRRILGRLLEVTRYCLGDTGPGAADADGMVHTTVIVFRGVVSVVLPVMLVVLVLALVSAFAQVGVLFTLKPLAPSFSKLNPINGLKKMFNARAFVQLAMGVAKTLLLTVVAYWTLKSRADLFGHASLLDHLSMVAVAAETLFTLGLRLAMVLLILGIIDFIYQRWQTETELKMTKEEVKDELKSMEGDPKVRQKRREIQLQLTIQRIRAAVPRADVVVTNPTEIAVAIRYDSETMNAPKVTAKGADWMARRIRAVAIEYGVPIVERKPLAQALYTAVEVGQEIPVQFYKAVAEVLAYVYELAGRRSGVRSPAGSALN